MQLQPSDINKMALIEGLKELARTGLLAAIPVVIAGLEVGHVDYRAVGLAAAIAVLRAVDRFLHKSTLPVKGITQF